MVMFISSTTMNIVAMEIVNIGIITVANVAIEIVNIAIVTIEIFAIEIFIVNIVRRWERISRTNTNGISSKFAARITFPVGSPARCELVIGVPLILISVIDSQSAPTSAFL